MHRSRITRLLVCLLILILPGCPACAREINMPFNGDITFHSIALTIPRNFIRDSTQSSTDLWVFERGFYSAYILISRTDLPANPDSMLESYVGFINNAGGTAQRETFREVDVVSCSYIQDGKPCREILFVYGDSCYALSLRGGDEAEFISIIETLRLRSSAEIARENARSSIQERARH